MSTAMLRPNSPAHFGIGPVIGPVLTGTWHLLKAGVGMYRGHGAGAHGWIQLVEQTNAHETSLTQLSKLPQSQLCGMCLVPEALVSDLITTATSRTFRHPPLLDPMLAKAYTDKAKLAALEAYEGIIRDLGEAQEPLARYIGYDMFRDSFLSSCQKKIANGFRHHSRVLHRVCELRNRCDQINMTGAINRYYIRKTTGRGITSPTQVQAWLSLHVFTCKMDLSKARKNQLILEGVRKARGSMDVLHAYEQKLSCTIPESLIGQIILARFRHHFLSDYAYSRLG